MAKKENRATQEVLEEYCFINDYKKVSVLLLAFGLLFIIVGTEIVRLPPTVNGWSILGLMLLLCGILGLIKP